MSIHCGEVVLSMGSAWIAPLYLSASEFREVVRVVVRRGWPIATYTRKHGPSRKLNRDAAR